MPLTRLTPPQFFGTAFWLGFSINYVLAEAWLNHTAYRAIRHGLG